MPTDSSGSFGNVSDASAACYYTVNNSAMNSTEQLYCSIRIRREADASGPLIPGFGVPSTGSGGAFNRSNPAPTRAELDPYFSNVLGSATGWMQNSDFQIMLNNGTGEGGADTNIRKVSRENISLVAVNHHRGPMIMGGWGFDVADRPCPSMGSPFIFNQNVANDRSTWKAGPIDFRWDEMRKVWTMGHHMICGVAAGGITAPSTPCTPTSFSLQVFRDGNQFVTSPSNLSNCQLGETVTVYNRDPSLSQPAVPGMIFVIAARINYEYLPVWVGCPDECDSDPETPLPDCPEVPCVCSDEPEQPEPQP